MTNAAIGLIETRGYVGLVHATDAMNKAGRVEFVRQEHLGGAYVTTLVRGDVGAVRAAVDAGVQAVQESGNLVAAHVIPQLHPQARATLIDWDLPEADLPPQAALGLVETVGFVGGLQAADAAVKAADVTLANYYIVGSGYIIPVIRGDVSAVESAVEAAREAALRVADVKSALVIPSPHPGLSRAWNLGTREDALPHPVTDGGRALGFIECKGLVPLIEGSDKALKAAAVELVQWKKIGSAVVSSIFRGEVSSVQAAIAAGVPAADRVGQFMKSNVIPQPDAALAG